MSRQAVYCWPDKRDAALKVLTDHGVVLVSVVTPAAGSREFARQQIRSALRDLLSRRFELSPEQIHLDLEPGKRPGQHLEIPAHHIALSISHEQGLSVAAIYDGTAASTIGVDLLRIAHLPDWRDVAKLYLGEQITASIASAPLAQQASYFAAHWARLEAKFKCRGVALSEWSKQLERELSGYTLSELDLPEGYAGALAISQPAQRA
jgi:4'-phosphopantetheinyl transferase